MQVTSCFWRAQTVGVFNGGYWGVNIAPHGIYRVSLYLKAANDTVRPVCSRNTTESNSA